MSDIDYLPSYEQMMHYRLLCLTEEQKEMGLVKGQLEYRRFKSHDNLTRKEAILAKCYECMGEYSGGRQDCMGISCPLYQYYPYRGKNPNFTDED